MLLANRLKLLRRLRRNHVVMSVKIQGALSAAVTSKQTGGSFVALFFQVGRLKTFAIEAKVSQTLLQQSGASLIIPPRGILCRDGNQLGQQRRHFVLALPKPCENRIFSCGFAAQMSANSP